MESSWVRCVLGRLLESWPFFITVKEQPQSKVCVCVCVFVRVFLCSVLGKVTFKCNALQ